MHLESRRGLICKFSNCCKNTSTMVPDKGNDDAQSKSLQRYESFPCK